MTTAPTEKPTAEGPAQTELSVSRPALAPGESGNAVTTSSGDSGALVTTPPEAETLYTRRLSTPAKALIALLVAAFIGGIGYVVWLHETSRAVPAGFAMSNGRLESERIDVATKYAGRVADVRVAEGDWVKAGQVIAVMDTATLQAQLNEAEAATRQAEQQLDQAKALVAQRQTELGLAQQELDRAVELGKNGYATQQTIDHRRTTKETADAALRSANAQVTLANAFIEATKARAEAIKTQIADGTLVAPRDGRVQYRLALPGEVLPAGGRVVTLLDLSDIYMTIFLPTRDAGRLALGSEARLIFDAAPQYVVPARVSFVAADAQFTPKFVETQSERDKLMFRVKLTIPPNILRKYADLAKTGVTGVAYVKVAQHAVWPAYLHVKLPQ